jgi:threonine/homoserine/homoserine lactone efflux protein
VAAPVPARARRVFAHALSTNLLNAKVILFYLAFVPQFVAPALGSVALQTFLLGLVLTAMGWLYHLSLATLVARAAGRLAGNGRVRAAIEAVAGLLFLGFALRLFLTERRFA